AEGIGTVVDGAVVGAAEEHFCRLRADAGAVEYLGEGRPGPLGGAHGAEAPLLAGSGRVERVATVASTLERDNGGLRRHVVQVVEAEVEGALDQSTNSEATAVGGEGGDRKMVADVKVGVGHDGAAEGGGDRR